MCSSRTQRNEGSTKQTGRGSMGTPSLRLWPEGKQPSQVMVKGAQYAAHMDWHSETVSSTLTFLFYELAKRPEDYQRIYDELQDVDLNDLQQLTSLPHLNGAIKEALRLWPQLPSGGLRQTSDRPISIGGVTVPANTTIQAPRYCISRREYRHRRITRNTLTGYQARIATSDLLTLFPSDGTQSRR